MLSPDTIAALNAPLLYIAQLIYLDFPGLPVALCSANRDIVHNGISYRGASGLGTISPITDSPGQVKGLNFELSGASSEAIPLALDDAGIVQGTPATIRTAILDANMQLLDAPIDWTGRLDLMSIQEDGETCTIPVSAESSELDLLRGTPLTYSSADQKSLYPGDLAFDFQEYQLNKPIVWAGKQWLIALAGK